LLCSNMVCNSHVVSVMTGQHCQMQHTAVVVGSAGTIRLSGAAGFGGGGSTKHAGFQGLWVCGGARVSGPRVLLQRLPP
jgi:hypothetical protein